MAILRLPHVFESARLDRPLRTASSASFARTRRVRSRSSRTSTSIRSSTRGSTWRSAEWKSDRDRDRALAAALRDTLERYEANRRAGATDGPALRGVRLYELQYRLDPRARNRDRPDERRLLARGHRAVSPGCPFLSKLRAAWNRFWFAPASPENLGLCRLLFYGGVLFITWIDYSALAQVGGAFWRPIWWFRLLGPQPSHEVLSGGPGDLETGPGGELRRDPHAGFDRGRVLSRHVPARPAVLLRRLRAFEDHSRLGDGEPGPVAVRRCAVRGPLDPKPSRRAPSQTRRRVSVADPARVGRHGVRLLRRRRIQAAPRRPRVGHARMGWRSTSSARTIRSSGTPTRRCSTGVSGSRGIPGSAGRSPWEASRWRPCFRSRSSAAGSVRSS